MSTGATVRQVVEALDTAATIAVSDPVSVPKAEESVPVKLVSAAEAAMCMGCSVQWVRQLATAGRIRSQRAGHKWLIGADDIDRPSPRRAA